MKKNQNLSNKTFIVITALINHFQTIPIIQETSHLTTQVIEVDHQIKKIHEVSHKIDIVDQIVKIISIETTIYDQIQTEENIRLIPVPIQILKIDTIQTIDHETHHAIQIETNQTIGIEVIQIIEINVTKTIDQETIHTKDLTIYEQITTTTIIDLEIIHKIGIKIITINKEIIHNLLIEIINRYTDSQHKCRSNTPKHQRQIIQVQTTKETTSDPPGIDDTGSTELQLNHTNCESTDSESDTNNTISVNMITVENDYEPIIYEQPFTSHIYENQLKLLQNYYIRPINNNVPVEQEVNEINTVIKPKKDEVQSSSTNHIYQNIQKKTAKRRNLDNSISLSKSKK